MTSFLLSFRAPPDYTPTPDTGADWDQFFGAISTHLEDIGNPIFTHESLGATGTDTALGGYSIIGADSLQEARELASGCPLLACGGGVEIGEITPVSENLQQRHSRTAAP